MIAYLRATLDASRATTHPLRDEFARLRDYLELMAIRMGPRLAYTLDLPADVAELRVPTLLLQPLVENSIKHGLEPKAEGGQLVVKAEIRHGKLAVTAPLDVLGQLVDVNGTANLTIADGNLVRVRFDQVTAEGLPDNPKGWLITTASRRRIEMWRSDSARTRPSDSTCS